MAERNTIPLRFERGLNREFATEVDPTSAQRLINFQPQPDGGLRVRRNWERASSLGAPDPARVLSIGALGVQQGFMTPIRRQRRRRQKRGNNVLDIEGGWMRETTEGMALTAAVLLSHKTAATSAIDVDPPLGWEVVGVIHGNNAPSSISLHIFKYLDAPERVAPERFEFSDPVHRAVLEIHEWDGIADVDAEDVWKTANGHSAKADTDFSAATDPDFPKQLVLAFVGAVTSDRSIKLSEMPPGYFDFRDLRNPQDPGPQMSVGREDYWLNLVVARQVIINDGPQRFHGIFDVTATEDDAQSRWVAALVTFKAKERSANDNDYYLVNTLGALPEEHAIHVIDRDDLATGTWTHVGDLVAHRGDAARYPVSMVPGFGGMLISSPDVLISGMGARNKGLMQYTGTDLVRINRSPQAAALCLWNGRFWALGTLNYPHYMYFSAIGDSTTWNLDDWFQPIGNDGEILLDGAVVSEGLLIAKRDSLYLAAGPASGLQIMQLSGGDGMKGRCICPIPGGAVIAGHDHIWLYTGGAADILSRALDDWWVNPARTIVYTAYVNGLVYIMGANEDTCVVYDTREKHWWIDKPPNPLSIVFGDHKRLLGGSLNNSQMLWFQEHPGSTRDRDETSAETFDVLTQQIMLGSPARPTTPLWLWVAYAKRNYQTGHEPIIVTPIYDGVAGTPRHITEIHPLSGEVLGNGSFRIRVDVGIKEATSVHKVQYRIQFDATDENTTVVDLHAIELVYDLENLR